ncbi:MAG: hypothetical protein HUU54_08230 [Ignavibacteriaceae bacterium]|nr:hypothetical protein [Ignavibacteriaceae bacterium]
MLKKLLSGNIFLRILPAFLLSTFSNIKFIYGLVENPDKYAGKIWMIATDLNYRIEPITIGAKRFITDDESPLIEMIKLEGIKIAA